MIKALLEQVRQDELRILGCLTLVDFLNNQVENLYPEYSWFPVFVTDGFPFLF